MPVKQSRTESLLNET